MALKGRHWLGLWLLAALAALSLVIWRQTDGLRAARALAEARERHASLEGTRSELQRRIRDAESRAVLIPRAQQRLGLRQPADTEIILLPVPSGGGGGPCPQRVPPRGPRGPPALVLLRLAGPGRRGAPGPLARGAGGAG